MQDANSVITEAAKGIVEELRADYEVRTARMYEILGKDDPYSKAKRLIRAIGRHSPNGARLIQADLMAMFADIFSKHPATGVTVSDLHRSVSTVVQNCLENGSRVERRKGLRRLISVAESMLEAIDREDDREEQRERAVSITEARLGGIG